MKTASLINHIYDRGSNNPVPTVGMGCTILMWTDRHAGTIVAVGPDGRWIDIQEDTATRTDGRGMSDWQGYSYEPNPTAPVLRYTLRRNGKYIRQGESMRGGLSLLVGRRESYHDYSF